MNNTVLPPVMLIDDEGISALRHRRHWNWRVTGYTPSSVPKGAEVLGTDWSGAVISDIRMPGLSGMQFLQRAREIDRTCRSS